MRVLFLNHNYRHMATFNRGKGMAEILAKRDHEVTLLTVSRQQRYRPTWSVVNNVILGEMPNLGQNNSGEGYGPIDNLLRCAYALGNRFDIIHMLDHKPNASFAGFLGRPFGAKLIGDWVDWWGGPTGINDVPSRRFPIVGKFEEWWEVKTKLWADGVTTISTVLYDRAIEVGCDPERLLYLPNGAEVDMIKPIALLEARTQLSIPFDRRMIGFLGMSQGDMEIAMTAMQQLPDVWLMVIGPKNPRVLQQAEEFGVSDRLWQTDFIPDHEIGLYISSADLMCIPLSDTAANRGRLAGKLMYYMSSGRPTIVSPIGDTAKIVEQYGTGIVAKDHEFAQAIRKLLEDEQLKEAMGERARKTATEVFAWDFQVDKLENFYRQLLSYDK